MLGQVPIATAEDELSPFSTSSLLIKMRSGQLGVRLSEYGRLDALQTLPSQAMGPLASDSVWKENVGIMIWGSLSLLVLVRRKHL